MGKHYKIIVNLLKGEQTIDLAVQEGQALRIWVAEGANYLLQSRDERGHVAPLAVKARRVDKDLQLMFDGALAPQVILIGYHELAQDSHIPLLGQLPDGTLREYVVLDAQGAAAEAVVLPEGHEPAPMVLAEPMLSAGDSASALAPLVLGPGALAAVVAGVAAAGGGGGGGSGGTGAPVLTPEEALLQLQTAARLNTAQGLGIKVYQAAGVTGITEAIVATVNDVLNSAAVTDATVSSLAELQKIVDACAKVFKLADGQDGNLINGLSVADCETLTLGAVSAASASLLGDVVDGKAFAAVDTVAKLQALADAAQAVTAYSGLGSGAPTFVQINSLLAGWPGLGNELVTSDAQAAVQNAILANNTDGDGVIVSQSELAGIVKSTMSAFGASLGRIIFFAESQALGVAGRPIPPDTIPTLPDYQHLGVTGVSSRNLGALNDALASESVNGDAVFTAAKLQTVIDAYNAILAEANGSLPDATPSQNPTPAQYAAIGANIGSASEDAQDLALLNDALGAQTSTGVATIAEINNLARITNAIQAMAAGQTPSPGLTVADLAKIGVNTQGLSDSNPDQWAALQRALAAKPDDGSQTDSLAKLQAIVQQVLRPASVSPVVLDLDGDGALSYTTRWMDVTGDGRPERSAWVGAQDGVLVRDADGNDRVSGPGEFAFARHSQETDLQGLAATFDTNRDGILDRQDAAFGEFKVWQDANGNGLSDAGELHSLQALGLLAVLLHSDGVLREPAPGVHEAGRSLAVRVDGSTVLVADAAFDHSTAAPITTGQLQFHDLLTPLGHPAPAPSTSAAVFGDAVCDSLLLACIQNSLVNPLH